MFCFIVLLLLAGAAFYFYQRLGTVECELDALRDSGRDVTSEIAPDAPISSKTLEDDIIAAVVGQAGIKQTELYSLFTDIDNKELQQQLKEMADKGALRREKQGSSYLLYPL